MVRIYLIPSVVVQTISNKVRSITRKLRVGSAKKLMEFAYYLITPDKFPRFLMWLAKQLDREQAPVIAQAPDRYRRY